MVDKKYTGKLEEYLHGSDKNLVKAAFLLQEWGQRYNRYEGNYFTSDYHRLYSSFPRVGEVSRLLLKRLEEGNTPTLQELAGLEKCFEELEEDKKEDQRIYGARRARLRSEYEDQRYMDAHTDVNGNWCPKGPD
jgi:uncharacterized protein YceH (UPF0502 family)